MDDFVPLSREARGVVIRRSCNWTTSNRQTLETDLRLPGRDDEIHHIISG